MPGTPTLLKYKPGAPLQAIVSTGIHCIPTEVHPFGIKQSLKEALESGAVAIMLGSAHIKFEIISHIRTIFPLPHPCLFTVFKPSPYTTSPTFP